MPKFAETQNLIFSVFSSQSWKSNQIATFPSNFSAKGQKEYIRVNVIPSSRGINRKSVSGLLQIDIFVAAGDGPDRVVLISDTLDAYLVAQEKSFQNHKVLQLFESTLRYIGIDEDDATLYRALYTIPFNFTEVL